jgi:nucleoside-diphosphate-sugar epimerase
VLGRTALVIGGTGPSGPHVLEGLLERGFDVTIFHRGTHEPPGLPEVRHVHGDPHFAESIADAVGLGEWDVVLAAYGRTRLLAESFAGRAGHFLAIGGTPRYAGFNEPRRLIPSGPALPVREDAPLVTTLDAGDSVPLRFAQTMVRTEEAVFAAHPGATYLIYPVVYGPRNLVPWEWSVIRRVQDGRRRMILPDDGLAIFTRAAARNLAQFTLLAIDRPEVSSGQIYNCADDAQYTVRQFTELILDVLGADIEIVGVPTAVSPYFKAVYVPTAGSLCDHILLDTSKARADLGYRDVVTPREALVESVAWYQKNPIDPTRNIAAYVDRFDYDLEDGIIDAWLAAVAELGRRIEQPTTVDVHPMPHPKHASLKVDEKAR